MGFFRDSFWGFAQFVVATLDFLRGLLDSRKQASEAHNQVSSKSAPIVEKFTEWRFLALVLLMTFASDMLHIFVMRVFVPYYSFEDTGLFVAILDCFDVLVLISLFYGRILLPICLLLQLFVACILTSVIMEALKFGKAIYGLTVLEDLKVTNVIGVLIIFLITYFVIFALTFPIYMRNRRVWASPEHLKKAKQSAKQVQSNMKPL